MIENEPTEDEKVLAKLRLIFDARLDGSGDIQEYQIGDTEVTKATMKDLSDLITRYETRVRYAALGW